MSLDQHLILSRYFHSLFGVDSFESLKDLLRTCSEERDEEGMSSFCKRLRTFSGLQIAPELMAAYDMRIMECEDRLRLARTDFRSFRYFQYLALLYTEIYLDRLTSDPEGFATELTLFASSHGAAGGGPFKMDDLRRLAFFMATGSGKTLLLHAHLWQMWRYLKEGRYPEGLVSRRDGRAEFNDILLITPNAGLSEQHINSLRASGIEATLLIEDRESGAGRFWPRVKVVEIHKLAENVSGDGVSVALDELGSANLVFVDEGHKGTGTEARTFKTRQQRLSQDGFLVEYSATFAQAIAAAPRNVRQNLLSEYGRCILFDYSYRHFFGDGYGKSFEVLNASNASEDRADEMLLGGLLVFYMQLRLFKGQQDSLRSFNIASPLWILLGTSVSKGQGKRADTSVAARSERADVARVIAFFRRFAEDREWATNHIRKFLEGQSGFRLRDSRADLFARPLERLRKAFTPGNADELYAGVCNDVLHGSGGLEVWELKKGEGEFGVRLSNIEGDELPYFGVVNIGDALSFRKHIEEHLKLTVHADTQRDALFSSLDAPGSRLNILIGAKKFIEGWSSWRVSAMGLMNIGKGEGSQIMQLFGRGIRLKGWNMSLKRSDFVETGETPPDGIHLLETLYVFGWNAHYMAQFQGMIDAEDIPVFRDLPLFPNKKWPKKGMLVPKPEGRTDLLAETWVYDDEQGFEVDLTARLTAYTGDLGGQALTTKRAGGRRIDFKDAKHMLDEGALYALCLERAGRPDMGNTFLSRERFRGVLEKCSALLPEEDAANRNVLQQAAAQAVSDALRRGFNAWQRRRMNSEMAPRELCVKEVMPQWRIQVGRDTELLARIEAFIEKPLEKFDRDEPIPRLYMDWHLYNPLFLNIEKDTDKHLIPLGLVDSEVKFLRDLRKFWKREHKKAQYRDWKLFVLRNPSPGGVALYGEEGRFVPDFILWLKNSKQKQTMVCFVEPHGLHHESENKVRSKAQCLLNLIDLSREEAFRQKGLAMDGWILSDTKISEVPWAGKRGWPELRSEFKVLSMAGDYMPTILECK